ncbi:MAG: hypothetical protein JNL39_23040 [Opitutaceae bacterium]|nr:hypothetical protein [Opitutaceae bacterium]
MPQSKNTYVEMCLAGFITISVMAVSLGFGSFGVFALLRIFGPMGELGTWGWVWFCVLSSVSLLLTLGFGWWAQRWLVRKLIGEERGEPS